MIPEADCAAIGKERRSCGRAPGWPTLDLNPDLQRELGKPFLQPAHRVALAGDGDLMTASLALGPTERVYSLVSCAARQPDVRAVVEANHDDNRWWPLSVADWRVRMAAAGWSTRVSYSMISTYADVVRHADSLGWSGLTALDDKALATARPPAGPDQLPGQLPALAGRVRQPRGGGRHRPGLHAPGRTDPRARDGRPRCRVQGRPVRGPVRARLPLRHHPGGLRHGQQARAVSRRPARPGPDAHEQLRHLLQDCTSAMPDRYRELASALGYRVHIPPDADPAWFVHLVLIYFKRLYPAARTAALPRQASLQGVPGLRVRHA